MDASVSCLRAGGWLKVSRGTAPRGSRPHVAADSNAGTPGSSTATSSAIAQRRITSARVGQDGAAGHHWSAGTAGIQPLTWPTWATRSELPSPRYYAYASCGAFPSRSGALVSPDCSPSISRGYRNAAALCFSHTNDTTISSPPCSRTADSLSRFRDHNTTRLLLASSTGAVRLPPRNSGILGCLRSAPDSARLQQPLPTLSVSIRPHCHPAAASSPRVWH
ncbi:hypothetical protein VTO73DRAFT_14309 [Trametes versicolor]